MSSPAGVNAWSDRTAGHEPKVTVVTVVLNSVDLIEETILSVLSQDYHNIEFMVVDGGSTDGTLDVISKYKGRIDQLVVEKDSGIYDAMNKSARLATGEYIVFMNSGDMFFDKSSLADLCNCIHDDETLVYGRWVVKYPWGLERAGRPASPDNFWRGMFAQHQSIMVKTRYLQGNPFDLSLGLGADYAFLLGMVNSGGKYQECNAVVSLVSSGGASDSNRVAVLRSHWGQARHYYPGLRTDVHYLKAILREVVASSVRRVLPTSLVRVITGLKS